MRHRTEILVETFKRSGLTQKAFCGQHGIGLSALKYHLYKTKKLIKVARNSPLSQASFVTFDTTSVTKPGSKDSRIDLTIIHGRFTASQVASIVNDIEPRC
jgi:hypothetical protein